MILEFGTAGWSYKDWTGTVYPEKIPSGFNHLNFIASQFDFVEVNTTFYRIPDQKLVKGWIYKTSGLDNFKFWIKLNQIFTHNRKYSESDVQDFEYSISPLEDAGKMGGLLIQFPYSFKLTDQNLEYLLRLSDKFTNFIKAVEFRHNSWMNSELFDLFEQKGLVWVNIDQPVISQSIPTTSIVTNREISYFRLQGRNYKSWFSNEGRDERYNYL
ncbi:MAG: DUF72 domain-containing protein, partial [Candidatus Aminicenantes bacterium]|nr:DUF72 domain-containing protein [Candidatus Aminicenantes bacterium]